MKVTLIGGPHHGSEWDESKITQDTIIIKTLSEPPVSTRFEIPLSYSMAKYRRYAFAVTARCLWVHEDVNESDLLRLMIETLESNARISEKFTDD